MLEVLSLYIGRMMNDIRRFLLVTHVNYFRCFYFVFYLTSFPTRLQTFEGERLLVYLFHRESVRKSKQYNVLYSVRFLFRCVDKKERSAGRVMMTIH